MRPPPTPTDRSMIYQESDAATPNMVVYKYRIGDARDMGTGVCFNLELPVGAEPLYVATQGNIVYLWAKVNPDATTETYTILSIATGGDVPPGATYLHSVIFAGFIWHLFWISR